MKRRYYCSIFLTAGFVILTFFSCSNKSVQWKGQIETRDGIPYIHNPNEPISDTEILSIISDITIGQDTEEPEGITFKYLLPYGCIDVDTSGNIYVLDSGVHKVFILDSQGRYLKHFGKKGQGPGEFQTPSCMKIMPDGKINIVDNGNRKIIQFDSNGNYIGGISLTNYPSLARPMIDPEGGILGMYDEFEPRTTLALIRIPPNYIEPAFYFKSIESRPIFDGNSINLFFPQFEFTVSTKGYIIWGFQDKYILNISSLDGRAIRNIENEYDQIVLPYAVAEARAKQMFSRIPGPMNYKIEHPQYYWPFSTLIADESGRLLARTPHKTADGKSIYDLFDEEGRLLSRLAFYGSPVLWKNNFLFIVDESSLIGQVIKRYRVEYNIDTE